MPRYPPFASERKDLRGECASHISPAMYAAFDVSFVLDDGTDEGLTILEDVFNRISVTFDNTFM